MLHWHSFSGWGRVRISDCFAYYGRQYVQKTRRCTNVHILRWTVAYLNATVNIDTRNSELEIGPAGSCLTYQNHQVDRSGSRFGRPCCSGSGFWIGHTLNWSVIMGQTRTTGRLPGAIVITSADHYTLTPERSDENDRVENQEAAGNEISSSINESSDCVNRIDYIAHINWVQMLVCEGPNMTLNFWRARVPAHQSSLPQNNWRNHWGRIQNLPRWQEGSGASGWWGDPRFR